MHTNIIKHFSLCDHLRIFPFFEKYSLSFVQASSKAEIFRVSLLWANFNRSAFTYRLYFVSDLNESCLRIHFLSLSDIMVINFPIIYEDITEVAKTLFLGILPKIQVFPGNLGIH